MAEKHILALAPDGATSEKAKALATIRKWRNLEGNERAVWGECKSSGAAFYKTRIDLKTSDFKCNCPSRKIPCKHSLALMMIYVQNSEAFKISPDMPDWVAEWLGREKEDRPPGRTEEEERKLAEQRIRNRHKRLFQMEAGFNELEIWLSDLIRQGLAVLEGRSANIFREISERMVNAKLGSLARRLRNLETLIGQKDWHEKLLAEIGEVYLLLKGFKNLEILPPNLQQELLNVAGINFKKEDLLELNGVNDTWFVVGQTEGTEDAGLYFRRTWIVGQKTGRIGLILDFAWGARPYAEDWKVGHQFNGEVVYYPAARPMRVLVKNLEPTSAEIQITGFENFEIFSQNYAVAVGENPWLSVFPSILENITPVFFDGDFFIVDRIGNQLPVLADEVSGWKMLALSGGHPIHVFGQWDGHYFELFSAVLNGNFHTLKDNTPLPRPSSPWNS